MCCIFENLEYSNTHHKIKENTLRFSNIHDNIFFNKATFYTPLWTLSLRWAFYVWLPVHSMYFRDSQTSLMIYLYCTTAKRFSTLECKRLLYSNISWSQSYGTYNLFFNINHNLIEYASQDFQMQQRFTSFSKVNNPIM